MHFLKASSSISALCALLTTCAAMPAPAPAAGDLSIESNLKTRDELTDKEAVVNVYSESSCGGTSTQYTEVTGGNDCRPIKGSSIQVSARYADLCYQSFICPWIHFSHLCVPPPFFFCLNHRLTGGSGCSTTTYSDDSCEDDPNGIPNSSCYSGMFGSVRISC